MTVYRIPTTQELGKLDALWHEFAPPGTPSPLHRYREPHRKYHNTGHLVEVLELFEQHRADFRDPRAVALALFFHDAVYAIPGPDNETESAALALRSLPDAALAARVADLVLMTKTHAAPAGDVDAALMLDIDMCVLGAASDRYKAYATAIAAEFAPHMTPHDYAAGRSAFLKKCAVRERLFLTDAFEARYGAQARANMADELQKLQPPRPPLPRI